MLTVPPLPLNTVEPDALLRLPAVVRMTGLARSTIYKYVALNQFPTPVSLLGRTVAWRFAEIREWTRSRPNAHFVDERERRATRDLSPQSPAGQREPLAAPRGARRA